MSANGAYATAEDVDRQLQLIRDEVTADPLLSHPETLSGESRLVREFESDEVYHAQVVSLYAGGAGADGSSSARYKTIRFARRDGNCFFRCASFRLLELMMIDGVFAQRCLDRIQPVKAAMLELFGEYSSDFSDVVEEMMRRVISGDIASADALAQVVTSEEAGYVIVFFRYAVSVHLRQHEEDFLPFVMGMGYASVEAYCTAEVEPVDHESDNVQLVGFAQLFDVTVVVEALDRSAGTHRTTHRMNDDDTQDGHPRHVISLLFRPGHYDLLGMA